jgi:CHAT domain-containing protein
VTRIQLFIGVLLVMFTCSQRPVADAPADWQAELAAADTLYEREQFEAAGERYQLILPRLMHHTDGLARWLKCQRRLSFIYRNKLKQPDRAIEFVRAAIDTLAQKGFHSDNMSAVNDAAVIYTRGVALGRDLGDHTLHEQSFRLLDPLFRQHIKGKMDELSVSTANFFYSEYANFLVQLGEYTQAIQLFEESEQYANTHQLTDFVAYNDYGSAYLSQHDYSRALAVFERGLSDKTQSKASYALLLLNKSEALARLKRWPEAIRYNQSAHRFITLNAAAMGDSYNNLLIGWLENQAIMAVGQANWSAAAARWQTAIDSARQFRVAPRKLAGYLNELAQVHLQQHHADQALQLLNEAFHWLIPTFQSESEPQALPEPSLLFAEKVLIELLISKAACFEQQGETELALRCYELIPQVEALLRANHNYESSTLTALSQSRQRIEHAVELAWKGWRNDQQPHWAARAFALTEQARALLQIKGLTATEAANLLTPEQRAHDTRLRVRVNTLELQLAEGDTTLQQQHNQALQEVKRELAQFQAQLLKDNTAYSAAMGRSALISFDSVCYQLRPGQTMLNYFWAEQQALHVFKFDQRGTVHWRRTPFDTTQMAGVRQLSRFLGEQQVDTIAFQQYRKQAFELYQLLLQPELTADSSSHWCKGSNNNDHRDTALLLVPDHALSTLSFEALLTDKNSGHNWRDLPYLILNHSVGYAASATLLALQRQLPQQRIHIARPKFAGFAPVYSKEKDRLDSAQTDVQYAAQRLKGASFVNEQATEYNFYTEAPKYQVLLLSMHGISDHRDPKRSHLRFCDAKRDSISDNILYANELQALHLKADLVVLSACYSGDGPLREGEGTYSLARAFNMAGVPATVMSLWRLPVVSSSPLVRGFFDQLKDRPKDAALRNAKLTWINTHPPRLAHPYFWAGLVAAGDLEPLPDTDSKWPPSWAWVLGAGILLLGAGWWWKRRG